ncbi:MAG: TIGR04086 family membrane protein [Methanobacterium sp.]|nr:TIGR04086 family membrane protein [Methanobacterium sp.]
MSYKWQCINIECDYKEYGNKGDKCPKCGRSFYKVDNEESKKIFGIKDKYKSDPNSIRKNKYHPLIAIIIGYLISGILHLFQRFLPNVPLSSIILSILITILGGFIATYLSRTNKAIIGFYEGLLVSILTFLTTILIFKTGLTLEDGFVLVLVWPISGLVGGYIAKMLRSHSE